MTLTTVTTITATCDNCGTVTNAPSGTPNGWCNLSLHFVVPNEDSSQESHQAFQFCNVCYTGNSGMTAVIASKVSNF